MLKTDFRDNQLKKVTILNITPCASLVYKFRIAFQTRTGTDHYFYWIVFSAGVFREINLALLVYQ